MSISESGIWHLSREYSGIAEAGGIKDVAAGIATGLARKGIPTTVVLPAYGFLNLEALETRRLEVAFELSLPEARFASRKAGETITVYTCRREGVRLFLLQSPRTLAKRSVYTYTEDDEREDPEKRKGTGHWDALHLNQILSRGALELARRLEEKPFLFHCHDGHAGFLPAEMRELACCRRHFQDTATLLTIHNAGGGYHQEIHGLSLARSLTGLPMPVLKKALLQEAVDPLLLGALYGEVNTVSEGYARELVSGEVDDIVGGLGLAYRSAGVRLLGITNGIDPQPFDPRRPEASGIPWAFDPLSGDLKGKTRCRELLESLLERSAEGRGELLFSPARPPELQGLARYGSLDPGKEPLFTLVGRLTGQKGVDVLHRSISDLLSRRAPAKFLLLGEGERGIEEDLIALTSELPARGKLAVLIGYNSRMAKLIYAAGDFFLIPSRYEPCGLTDLYAQMMGNIPIARRVGGLEKVREGFNGYSYEAHSASALSQAILRSLDDFHADPLKLQKLRRQAFQEILDRFTWDRVLEQGYIPLYEEAGQRLYAGRL